MDGTLLIQYLYTQLVWQSFCSSSLLLGLFFLGIIVWLFIVYKAFINAFLSWPEADFSVRSQRREGLSLRFYSHLTIKWNGDMLLLKVIEM